MDAPPSGTLRLLVVDPDPGSAARFQEILGTTGYTVVRTPSGEEARAAFRADPPAACVVDAAVQDVPALDLLRTLRKERPEVPVLVMNGRPSVSDIVAAMRLGAADYLVKPLDAAKVSVQLRNAFQHAWERRELEHLEAETGSSAGRARLDEILRELVSRGGSDLHLKAGRPPIYRVSGDLLSSDRPALEETEIAEMLRHVLGEKGYASLQEDYESDTSYILPGLARFRVNAFKRMGVFGAALRLIPLTPPTIELMKLPDVLKEICKAPQGLVLLTGPTGSGKSTTLAAMIEHLNETEPLHVVTIEDPVEFVYTDKQCTINQRQLGTDVKSLTEALRRVLRQDPDVILMGEMRDRETIELAMHAAETGHLVFSTLHTNDAKQTLDRIADMFPTESHPQVRAMLALTLRAVVSQRLVRRADGAGRVAAVEVMINSPNIRELIAEGKTSQIEKAIGSSGDYYKMQTFNQALARLVQGGTITEEEAVGSTLNPGDLRLILKGVTGGGSGTARPSESAAARTSPNPMSDSGRIKINRGF